MLLKCHHHLHPMTKFEVDYTNQRIDEDCNIDVFKKAMNTSEPMKELIAKKLLIFKHYQMDPKEIKSPFQ